MESPNASDPRPPDGPSALPSMGIAVAHVLHGGAGRPGRSNPGPRSAAPPTEGREPALAARKLKTGSSDAPRGWTSKQTFSTQVSTQVLEEVRDCIVALSGPPDRLTVSAFVENALRRELQRLSRKRNAGKRFSKRRSGVRPGRPLAP